MRSQRVVAFCFAAAFCAAGVYSATFRAKRPVEFHLAEDESGRGLEEARVADAERVVYLHPQIELDDRDIVSAAVATGKLGEPIVRLQLRATGVSKLSTLTTSPAASLRKKCIVSRTRSTRH